ncbi:MAG: VanW family protein [Nocardioides sp.]
MGRQRGDTESEGGKVVLFLLLGLVLLFGGAYLAAGFAAGDKVPRGTTISGVDVGGLDGPDAERALREGLAERVGAPIPVTVEGDRHTVSPERAGLAVDYAASVEAAGGEQSWSPARLWDYFTGGDDLDAVVAVDDGAMTRATDRLIAESGTLPRDGDVRFVNGQVRIVQPRPGEQIDAAQARAELEAAYLQEEGTADLDLSPTQPTVDDADVRAFVQDFANPAMSAPVSLIFDKSRYTLTPRQYDDALGATVDDGELRPELDEKKLLALVDKALAAHGAPVDATVRLVDGKPQVVPDRPGVTYERADVEETFLELVRRPSGERERNVKATLAQAEFQTKDARKLRIVERVSQFTTYYPHAAYRNTNIGRAAELVSGTVLKPGETFSLNETVGERTRANGFTKGFIIEDGIYKEDFGGGVSQMATTTFNAMFFAGLEDVEHKTHSFYIDRYPLGREATVAWGSVDLRFRNDTPYGVLIDARVTPSTVSSSGVVTVRMFSTKYWDITSSVSDRYDFVEEDTRRLDSKDCYPNDGYAGFDVDVTRLFRRAGEDGLHHREEFHTTYLPSDTVICE